jgi:hypothetical protein
MSFFDRLFNRKEQESNQQKNQEFDNEFGTDEDQEMETAEEEIMDAEGIDNASEEGEIEYEVVEREILPAKIICPDCGGITLEGLDFCDKCGGELH